MTSIIKLQPFSGAHNESPPCYMLQVDEFRFLLDCGWDEDFSMEFIKEIKRHAHQIDAILLTYPDHIHLGALPYLIGKGILNCPIYATIPVYKMGQMFMYDLYQSRHNTEDFNVFTLDDVDVAFDKIVQLKYSQTVHLKGKGHGIQITPLPAGHMLGGTIWKIIKDGEEEIVYAVDYNHKKERHLNGCVLENISRPSLMITDAFNATYVQSRRRARDEQLLTTILQTMRNDGNVLVAVDTAGRMLELAQLLDQMWRNAESGLSPYSLALLNNVSFNVVEFAKSQVEWMSDKIMRSFEEARNNPFHFKHVKLCHNLAELARIPEPKVVLASVPDLQCGFSRDLFLAWCGSPKNSIILTNRTSPGTLARWLIDNPENKTVTMDIRRRVKLEGAELDDYLRKRKNKEQEELRIKNEQKRELEDESSDESETEMDTDAQTVTSKGKHDLMMKSEGKSRTGFFKQAKKSYPMFPFSEEKLKWDDYGEIIRPEDYTIIDVPQTDEDSSAVQCFNTNCMNVNHIPTGKRHDRIWDVNTKLATGLVHSGIAVRQLNSLLAELNIPTVHYKTINARLKETGKMVEKIAIDSTDEALQNEIKAVEQTNGKFVVAVDAGWQKRGSGRSYNSLSGHCSMVGTQTGQIIHYAVRSKDCRVCSTAASRNEPPKPHDCYQNWEGSAKAMEADMVTQMVKDVGEKGFKVEAIVGDEDSTTIGRLRANVNEKIEKISDKNHIRKLLGNSLYALKKQHPMLTVKVIKYLQRCFDYIIAQGKENPSQISSDLNALSKHPFGDHSSCSSRWCRFIGNPNCLYKSFPHGKPLANQCLQSSLEKVFSTYAGHSNKLSSLGSTQGNESFNHMVAAKAPKNIHFSSSGNLSYRVAACVAQKNSGHKYLVSENVKKQDSAIQDLSEVPTKCVAATVTLDINANIQYIDFEGRSDGESIKKILSQIKPRQLILVRATTEATEALAEYCRKNEGVVQGKIFLPHIGEVVDVTRESHIFQVRLRDYVVSALEFAKAKETELAWIDGILDMSRGKVDTGAMYDAEEGELTEEKARKIQDGVLNGEEDPMEVVPTVEALPHNQFVGHKAVFINEPKLSDFKLVLLQEGISAEFIAGVLICNNNVAVRRNEAGRIQLEGTICEDFFKIRQILYSQYAIV